MAKKRENARHKRNAQLDITPVNVSGALLNVLRSRIGRCGFSIQDVQRHAGNLLGLSLEKELVTEALQHLCPLVQIEGDFVYPSAELLQSREVSFFDARRRTSRREKRAVAKYIHDTMMTTLGAVFLDGGSACEAIAEEMARGEKGQFTVMTNNRKATKAFMTNEKIRIHLTGGIYKADDETFVGHDAVFDAERFNVKYAIVGVSGITPTHVYNHDILGEEFIKKRYWQIPAEWLIVPASLKKFEGKDASCFGVLCHAEEPHTEDGADVHAIRRAVIEEKREAWWSNKYGEHGSAVAPRFRADNCRIVIEPLWMIEENFAKHPEERESLLAKV